MLSRVLPGVGQIDDGRVATGIVLLVLAFGVQAAPGAPGS